MGTRHLIEVIIDGEIKVAQYGQWDGYYTGQGASIADFIHKKLDRDKFLPKLRGCTFMTKAEIDAFNDEHGGTNWQASHPWLSRDAGADILGLIQDHGPLALVNESEFKNDRIFCEYYYVINMDFETVGVSMPIRGELTPTISVPFSEWTHELMEKMEQGENEA